MPHNQDIIETIRRTLGCMAIQDSIIEEFCSKQRPLSAPIAPQMTTLLHLSWHPEIYNANKAKWVAYMIHVGTDINYKDIDGRTPLMTNVENASLTSVRALLSYNNCKIDAVDRRGETALHIACRSHDGDVLQEILKYDVDPMEINNAGQSPLHLAVQAGNVRYTTLLLRYMYLHNDCIAFECELPRTERIFIMGARELCEAQGSWASKIYQKYIQMHQDLAHGTEVKCQSTPFTEAPQQQDKPSVFDRRTSLNDAPTKFASVDEEFRFFANTDALRLLDLPRELLDRKYAVLEDKYALLQCENAKLQK